MRGKRELGIERKMKRRRGQEFLKKVLVKGKIQPSDKLTLFKNNLLFVSGAVLLLYFCYFMLKVNPLTSLRDVPITATVMFKNQQSETEILMIRFCCQPLKINHEALLHWLTLQQVNKHTGRNPA